MEYHSQFSVAWDAFSFSFTSPDSILRTPYLAGKEALPRVGKPSPARCLFVVQAFGKIFTDHSLPVFRVSHSCVCVLLSRSGGDLARHSYMNDLLSKLS